ncbi:MAG: PASTA domain-containing protein [Candidatus Dormiibacterota bacterium]
MALGSLGTVHAGTLAAMPRYSESQVPDMKLLTANQARWLAYKRHLTITVHATYYPSLPIDTVIAQEPPPGDVPANDHVNVTVSFPARVPKGEVIGPALTPST